VETDAGKGKMSPVVGVWFPVPVSAAAVGSFWNACGLEVLILSDGHGLGSWAGFVRCRRRWFWYS